jgi:hypothetical protein
MREGEPTCPCRRGRSSEAGRGWCRASAGLEAQKVPLRCRNADTGPEVCGARSPLSLRLGRGLPGGPCSKGGAASIRAPWDDEIGTGSLRNRSGEGVVSDEETVPTDSRLPHHSPHREQHSESLGHRSALRGVGGRKGDPGATTASAEVPRRLPLALMARCPQRDQRSCASTRSPWERWGEMLEGTKRRPSTELRGREGGNRR